MSNEGAGRGCLLQGEQSVERLKQKVLSAFLLIIQIYLDEEDEMMLLIRYILLFYGCEPLCDDE